jgi:hypothetical protein
MIYSNLNAARAVSPKQAERSYIATLQGMADFSKRIEEKLKGISHSLKCKRRQ